MIFLYFPAKLNVRVALLLGIPKMTDTFEQICNTETSLTRKSQLSKCSYYQSAAYILIQYLLSVICVNT